MAGDTIFALSSGVPPAAIAIIRVSGPDARRAGEKLAGTLPAPRAVALRRLSDPNSGELLDRALALWMPGPNNATGEDLLELHVHGGRAVVETILAALGRIEGLRGAEPGEFTRKAFENGRIDLAEAEGLSDLLRAETEAQRRSALAMAEGGLSARVADWQARLLDLSAAVEAVLDFSDEDDVGESDRGRVDRITTLLSSEMRSLIERPGAERLRDGVRVAIAGPPNTGKSTLLNAIVGRDAAIVSEIAGTTRDIIEAPVVLGGTAYLFSDTAGIRSGSADAIERIGIARAQAVLDHADIILWLGDEPPSHEQAIRVHGRADLPERRCAPDGALPISAVTGAGLGELIARLHAVAATLLPREGELALSRRQRVCVEQCGEALESIAAQPDLLIVAECLRHARAALDMLTGRAGTEDMLDALFGTFCIGK